MTPWSQKLLTVVDHSTERTYGGIGAPKRLKERKRLRDGFNLF